MRANRKCSLCKNIGHDKRKCPLNIPPQSPATSTPPPVPSELPPVLRNTFSAFPSCQPSQRRLILPRNPLPRLNLHHQALPDQAITTTNTPTSSSNSIGTVDAPLVPLSVQETTIIEDTTPHTNGYIPFPPNLNSAEVLSFSPSSNPPFLPAYTAQSEILDVPFQFLSHMLLLIGKTIVHPKICHHNTRAVFTFYYTKVVEDPTNLLAWKKLILLPVVLFVDTENSRSVSLQHRLQDLLADKWDSFTIQNCRGRNLRTPISNSNAQNNPKHSRTYALIAKGELSRAYQNLQSSATVASLTAETLDKLIELHPPRLQPDSHIMHQQLPPDIRCTHTISGDAAFTLVRKSRALVAPGADGLRYEHLKFLVGKNSSPAEISFCTVLGQVLSLLANAAVPPEVSLHFAGSELIPLMTNKIRPIVLGLSLRALASKFIQQSEPIKLQNRSMSNIQKGSNISNGIDKIIHTVKCGRELFPEKHLLLTDFCNAFNSIDRNVILSSAKENYPSAFPLLQAMYSPVSTLWVKGMGTVILPIASQQGSQQGDVLGTLAFNSGLHAFALGANDQLDNANSFINFFVDDGSMLLETNELYEILSFLKTVGPDLGIHLKPSKVKVLLSQQQDSATAERIHRELTSTAGPHCLDPANVLIHPNNNPSLPLSSYGVVLLGSPVGSDEFCISFLRDLLDQLRNEAEKIKELSNTQSAFLLLKYSFSKKIQHLLRTIPPPITVLHLINPFNDLLRNLLATILNLNHLTDVQFQQSTLDVADGGLGLGDFEFTSHSAFAASFIESFPAIEEKIASIKAVIASPNQPQHISAYVEAINFIRCDGYDPLTILTLADSKSEKLQKLFTSPFKTLLRQKFMQIIENSAISTARVLSCATPEAGAFILTIPKTPKMFTTPSIFRTMILRRLGCDLPQLRPIQCICSSHPKIDLLGTHLIACKHGGQRHQTHDFMVHEISSCVKACGLYSKMERTNFFRSVSADNGKRPDLEVRGFDRGILGDVIITSPLSSQLTIQNASISGRAAAAAERVKNAKFQEDSSAANMLFLPFAFETYGRWGDSFSKFFIKLMTHGSAYTGIDQGTLTNYWRRRISMTLQKSIAAGILERMGKLNSSPQHDESNWASAVVDQSIVRY